MKKIYENAAWLSGILLFIGELGSPRMLFPVVILVLNFIHWKKIQEGTGILKFTGILSLLYLGLGAYNCIFDIVWFFKHGDVDFFTILHLSMLMGAYLSIHYAKKGLYPEVDKN